MEEYIFSHKSYTLSIKILYKYIWSLKLAFDLPFGCLRINVWYSCVSVTSVSCGISNVSVTSVICGIFKEQNVSPVSILHLHSSVFLSHDHILEHAAISQVRISEIAKW